MQRVMFNGYYDFHYLPLSTLNSSIPVVFDRTNQSMYAYEFVIDDRNIGGTTHLSFDAKTQVEIHDIFLLMRRFIR